MNLETLESQFIKARASAAIERSTMFLSSGGNPEVAYRRINSISVDVMAGLDPVAQVAPLAPATILAARRYVVARDFNVFDPTKADMIWKLQYAGPV